MDFDTKTYLPTYRLIMGSVGMSNALKIASALGLSADIVENASKRISSEKKQFDSVLLSAEETRRKAENTGLSHSADATAMRIKRRQGNI